MLAPARGNKEWIRTLISCFPYSLSLSSYTKKHETKGLRLENKISKRFGSLYPSVLHYEPERRLSGYRNTLFFSSEVRPPACLGGVL